MKASIWKRLPRPFFVLAPMENVTDTVFRRMVARCGRPDLFFTEFVSTAGLCSNGFERVKRSLEFTEMERPIIAQIWGSKPEDFFKSAKIISDMKFDGIDINMGCPVRKIVSKGSCSALINNPTLATEIIESTKEGSCGLPVSVKTRIGISEIQTEEWIGFLLSQNIEAITIHGRTAREMSKVPCHWEEIGKAVALRDQMKKDTIIVGNGDVMSREEGLEKYRKYKTDGIMIGRGVFQNLWMFGGVDPASVPHQAKLQLLIDHIELFSETWNDTKPFEIMKKFYKVYVSDIQNANNFRTELMQLKSPKETIEYIKAKILS